MSGEWIERQPVLEIASTGKRLPRHVIERGRTILGRHPSCHVVLPDRHSSREQLLIEWDGASLRFDDLGSKNRLQLNGDEADREFLTEGDVLRFGETSIAIRGRSRPESVCFSDDSVRVVAPTVASGDEAGDAAPQSRLTPSKLTPNKLTLDARDASVALPNAEAGPESNRLESIYRLAEELVSDHDDSTFYGRIADRVFAALPADRGFIATGDPSGGALDVVHVWHRDARDSERIEMSQTILDEMQVGQQALLVHDVPASYGRDAEHSIDQLGIVSFMCAPMVVGEDTTGFLYVDRRRDDASAPQSFTEEDLRFLTGVARLIGVAQEERALRDRLEHENLHLRQVLRRRTEIIGDSKSMTEVLQKVARVAERSSSVLILGETGTGKELIAQAIHDRSEREGGPFVAFNCALSSPQLIESELFGHVKGAFTDAARDHRGKFQLAEGGTLFLDEIGDMPLSTQVKLLRVLQEREVCPVGSEQPVAIDIRLIAATHRDLAQLRKDSLFRDDLYFRIAVLTVDLPPLRERGDDVLEIARALLPEGVVIDAPAAKAMLVYSWPGNVRELQNVVEQACFNANSRRIRLQDLPPEIAKEGRRSRVDVPLSSLSEVEAKHIRKVLKAVDNNKKRAAEILGISRETLYQKIRGYSL